MGRVGRVGKVGRVGLQGLESVEWVEWVEWSDLKFTALCPHSDQKHGVIQREPSLMGWHDLVLCSGHSTLLSSCSS